MRLLWNKTRAVQLDLLDAPIAAEATAVVATTLVAGQPLTLASAKLYEDPSNPRTEFPEAELAELAADIQQHGILQPIVVHPADADGRHRIHFGAKRLRAALRAGLQEVPVVVREAPADPYTQVAENQKRHGLSPLDLARFIRSRVDAGDSNATVAQRLCMNLTTVAHHLSLMSLPIELEAALKSGRCTSPRSLHELNQLHREVPAKVQELIAGGAAITLAAISALRGSQADAADVPPAKHASTLIDQANAACNRLERVLSRIQPSNHYKVAPPELIALRIRVETLAKHWLQGSDRQTPSQAER